MSPRDLLRSAHWGRGLIVLFRFVSIIDLHVTVYEKVPKALIQGNEAGEFAREVLAPMVAERVTWERGQGTSDSDLSSGQAPGKASEGQLSTMSCLYSTGRRC